MPYLPASLSHRSINIPFSRVFGNRTPVIGQRAGIHGGCSTRMTEESPLKMSVTRGLTPAAALRWILRGRKRHKEWSCCNYRPNKTHGWMYTQREGGGGSLVWHGQTKRSVTTDGAAAGFGRLSSTLLLRCVYIFRTPRSINDVTCNTLFAVGKDAND